MVEKSGRTVTEICVMEGVREHDEEFPLEFHRHSETGRIVIRCRNECGNNYTDLDLWDVIEWLRIGPRNREVLVDDKNGGASRSSSQRN
jgi:hypothetical protein